MLMVTHQMGFAKEFADRVCFFYAGKLAEAGPRAALRQPEQRAHPPVPVGSARGGVMERRTVRSGTAGAVAFLHPRPPPISQSLMVMAGA
jgi:ABC-type multidrug transport system ATPase subunit